VKVCHETAEIVPFGFRILDMGRLELDLESKYLNHLNLQLFSLNLVFITIGISHNPKFEQEKLAEFLQQC
jgi:hypothetical protein